MFVVVYRQDKATGYWTATIPQSPAVVTQGRSLKEARRSVRNALSLTMSRDKALSVPLTGVIQWDHRTDLMPGELTAVDAVAQAQMKVAELQETLDRALKVAAYTLSPYTYRSLQDVSKLLGVPEDEVETLQLMVGAKRAAERSGNA